MSMLENLFQQYLYIAKNVLKTKYDESHLSKILSSLEGEFKVIINSPSTQKVTPKDINQKMHIVTPCFVIALYRALKKNLTHPISFNEMKDMMIDIFRDFVGPLAEMQKNGLKNSSDKWKKFKETTIG